MLVGTLLRRNGATVSTARSSAEALGVLSTLKPNVIVCDIGMPDENGYAFIRKMRAIEMATGRYHVPAAALTAYARDEDRQDAFRAGFQVHLVKPVEEKSLVKTIAGLVENTQEFEA
jgi:CheY-like chemotaxis protein